ncbi:MAG TPA: hypothetical protein VNU25_00810 [Candidatus Paceibacterota bacterium]|nr:hypothetical protein [Candidatus Paceibacterota bacterium]
MRHAALIQLSLAIVLFVGVLGAYSAWYVTVGQASATSAALAKEIETKTQESARVASAREALETLAADEASIQAYLIRQEDIVSFLERLEGSGTSLGSSVEVVSVGAETGGERPHIRLSVKITGSFDAVMRTLGAIEYGPYDSAVTSVTLDTLPTESGPSGRWTASATLTLGTRTAP